VKTVERPEYQRVEADGAIELRDDPPLIVAEVDTRGDRQQSVRRGFGPLAGDIFARSRAGERVAMTAPVTQTSREQIAMTAPVTQTARQDGRWTVRFIMPAAYTLGVAARARRRRPPRAAAGAPAFCSALEGIPERG
jgi:hypothetical protein